MLLARTIKAAFFVALLAWFSIVVPNMLKHSAPTLQALPIAALSTLDEQPVNLNSYTGRPVVLNLWASWCHPCRRELPTFEQAQTRYPAIDFLMINQGESAQKVHTFLESQHLKLKNVLLDPASRTMRAEGSKAIPATLFFNEKGSLVDTHLGELTLTDLKNTVSNHLSKFQQTKAD